jgi:hypothetical protein
LILFLLFILLLIVTFLREGFARLCLILFAFVVMLFLTAYLYRTFGWDRFFSAEIVDIIMFGAFDLMLVLHLIKDGVLRSR